jgi:hypothetical protein
MKKRIMVVAVLVVAVFGIRALLRNRQQLGEFCCGMFPTCKGEPAIPAEPEVVAQVA